MTLLSVQPRVTLSVVIFAHTIVYENMPKYLHEKVEYPKNKHI